MPTITMSTVMPLFTTSRWRQERVNRLIALLKLRLLTEGDTSRILRALRGHDPVTVEFTFLIELDSLDGARIDARKAHEKAKTGTNLEELAVTRVAIYAADSAYALTARAYDAYSPAMSQFGA